MPRPRGADAENYLDRARYGLYPPGSTFKVVTAMAALRKDPALTHKTYECIRLPDKRVGQFLKGSKRPIRDDIQDSQPHGTVDLENGIVVSCNAYFAQLGTYDVGAEPLWTTANLLGIAAASPNTAEQLKKSLPQSSYGQGQVVASPFQMARVAATVANGGAMPQGRWITDETNLRTGAPQTVLTADAGGHAGKIHARSGDPGHRAARPAPPACRWPAKPERRSWRTRRRTPGSSGSRHTARERAKSPSPYWWRMDIRRHQRRAGGGGNCKRRGEAGVGPVRRLMATNEHV